MPPKKKPAPEKAKQEASGAKAAVQPENTPAQEEQEPAKTESLHDASSTDKEAQEDIAKAEIDSAPDAPSAASTKSKKRKQSAKSQEEPNKVSRKSARGTPKAQPSEEQLLRYLLSAAALDLCRPNDESEQLKEGSKDLRTYSSSALTPFEELLCATILSRPISHRLGHRTIRTVLNPPYNFTSPKAILDAGKEKVVQSVWDARTQHKEKTAGEISLVADVIADKFSTSDATDASLEKVRKEAEKDVDRIRDLLKTNIKGVGKTGLDIFVRRVQWLWPECYPFMDDRTSQAAKALGLPDDALELDQLVEKLWESLDTDAIEGEGDEKKRRAFVIILERLVGAQLENKVDDVLQEAAKL